MSTPFAAVTRRILIKSRIITAKHGSLSETRSAQSSCLKIAVLALFAIGGAVTPQAAHAQAITITVSGTITSGTDTTGIFVAPGTNLAGYVAKVVYTFNPAVGTPESGTDYSGIMGTTPSSPGISIVTIGGGSYTFGKQAEAASSSSSVLMYYPTLPSSADYSVADTFPNGNGSDYVIVLVTPATGAPPLSTTGNWESSFSDTQITGSANVGVGFFNNDGVYSGATATFTPSSITVSGKTGASCQGPPEPLVLIDPVVAGLVSGSSVTTNTDDIAAATYGPVQGAAADGTSQVVLRIPASAAGQTYTLTVFNDANSASTSVPNDGGLLELGGSSSSAASSLNVTSVMTASGAEVFAIYLPPVNFSRGSQDNSLTTRSVTLQTTCGTTTSTPVTVARPPVVLVHGLWGDAASFDNFTPLYESTIFNVKFASYNDEISDITSTTPSYEVCTREGCAFPPIEENSLGFAYNAPSVLLQIDNFINIYRTSAHVASVKADVVAHSMGGDISRTMLLLNSDGINLFLNNPMYPTFGAGPINKLITIATPHLGTPIASDLLASNNACARIALAAVGDIALQSVTFSGQTAEGAVYDLEGNGFGGALSPALTALPPPSTQPFPTAYIAGVATSANFDGLDCSVLEEGINCVAGLLRLLCGNPLINDPLAKDLTPNGWPTIFGQDNDAIVPLDSALNKTSSHLEYSGVIHSAALETLNFNGPSVLDPASGIPNEVIGLLNESPTGSDFY